MAVTSAGSASWSGDLGAGRGTARLESSGLASFDYSWKARSEGVTGVTTPEELLGTAHAACYAMALANTLAQKGFTPDAVDARSSVTFQPGEGITAIALEVTASVPGLDQEQFASVAREVSEGCPVSQALKAVPLTLTSASLR